MNAATTSDAPVRHVVWDWNGTLIDDAWLCVEIMDAMLRARGLPGLTRERYAELFDFPVRDYYLRLGVDFARDPFEVIGAEFIREYERRKTECVLQPGAAERVRSLARAGVGQTVVSAYHERTLRELLSRFGLDGWLSGIVGGGDIYAAGKLDRAMAWFRSSGLQGETILVVGDTLHDAEMARAMGARCWLLCAGHQSRRRLETAACPVFDRFADLPWDGAGLAAGGPPVLEL